MVKSSVIEQCIADSQPRSWPWIFKPYKIIDSHYQLLSFADLEKDDGYPNSWYPSDWLSGSHYLSRVKLHSIVTILNL